MIDLAKMVEEIATAGQAKPKPRVPAIAWTDGDRPESVRLVCIGWVSRSNLEDYEAHPEHEIPPMLWRKPSRHADQPVYVIGRDDA
jgi:hypothetical protein